MARPSGTRNPGYAEKRRRLAQAALGPLLDLDAPFSLRQVARSAGVSVPTMRHYFSDLDGVVEATFDLVRENGAPYAEVLAGARDVPGPLEASVRFIVAFVHEGWQAGVARLHAAGLARGLESRPRGRAYLDALLEPLLQAVEARLAIHIRRGELRGIDARQAGLSLVAPLVLAWLHQDALDGAACRPLDRDAFAEGHIVGWLRGYAA